MRKKGKREAVRHLTARITEIRRDYFITRSPSAPPVIDDEASMMIGAIIEETAANDEHHIGERLDIRLISAARYDEPHVSTFDGSIILRTSQRTASAYLPPEPFGVLLSWIAADDVKVRLQFLPTGRDRGSLVGLYIQEYERTAIV